MQAGEGEKVVVTRADLEQIVPLRQTILRSGLPRETAYFPGDRDQTTIHLAALLAGRVVGCATILLNQWEQEKAWQLRGMAVVEDLRAQGVGTRLIETLERVVRESDVKLLWCNARVPAIGFYQRMGWAVASAQFDVPTAGPHVKMMKRL